MKKSKDSGITLLELIIGITLTLIISVGVFQIIKLGYMSSNYTASAATKNGFTSSLQAQFSKDIRASSGFVVSSGTTATSKLSLCTSWDAAGDPDFNRVKPLLSVYINHAVTIKSATISTDPTLGSIITFATTSAPDMKIGQLVSVTGLSSIVSTDFNIIEQPIARVDSGASPGFIVLNTGALPVGTTTTTDTTANFVNVAADGLIRVDDATGIGDGMIVTWTGSDPTEYQVSGINPTTATFYLIPNPATPPSGSMKFVSTSNGNAISHSLVGYELRQSNLNGAGQNYSQLWRVQCQAAGQNKPDASASTLLRNNLPVIDNTQNSECTDQAAGGSAEKWTDWSCAIRCPQFSSDLAGSRSVSVPVICPRDSLLSSGQGAFVGNISRLVGSSSTDLYIDNSSNAASSVSVTMSIDFPELAAANLKQYVTSVDLTDASGDAHVTVKCVTASLGSTQSSATCPRPSAGSRIVLGSSYLVECILDPTTNKCVPTANNISGNDISKLVKGMYVVLPVQSTKPVFGVVSEISGDSGSQNVVFSQELPTDLPAVLAFSRPTGVQLWLPAVSVKPALDEQKIIAVRGTS